MITTIFLYVITFILKPSVSISLTRTYVYWVGRGGTVYEQTTNVYSVVAPSPYFHLIGQLVDVEVLWSEGNDAQLAVPQQFQA